MSKSNESNTKRDKNQPSGKTGSGKSQSGASNLTPEKRNVDSKKAANPSFRKTDKK